MRCKYSTLVAILMSSFLLDAAFANKAGRLAYVQGDVSVNGKEAKEGQTLKKNDIVETEDGKATLLLGPDNVVHLDLKSKMKIEAYSKSGSTISSTLNLMQGKTRALINAKSGKRKFKFRSKSATMGVRGTHIMMDADRGEYSVISGRADVIIPTAGAQGVPPAPVSLGENQSVKADGGGPIQRDPAEMREAADSIAAPPVEVRTKGEMRNVKTIGQRNNARNANRRLNRRRPPDPNSGNFGNNPPGQFINVTGVMVIRKDRP